MISRIVDIEVENTDDQVLQTTRSLRLAHIKDQLTNTGMPTSKEDFDIFDRNLRALESTAIANKRIKVDEKQGENSAEMMRIAVMNLQRNLGGDIFAVSEDKRVERTVINEQDIRGQGIAVDGELEVGVSEQTYDSYMQDIGDELDRKRKNGELDIRDFT